MAAGEIRIVGFDPAFANWGIAHAMFNMQSGQITVDDLVLIQTETSKHKDVRKNSDDLRRSRELNRAILSNTEGVSVIFSEVPTGTQSARASWTLGIAVGVLGAVHTPIIQLQPTEVKLATVGTKTASKQEMIEWAMAMHPDAPWIMRKSKGKMVPLNSNEHLADAVEVLYAGVQSDQFYQMRALLAGLKVTQS